MDEQSTAPDCGGDAILSEELSAARDAAARAEAEAHRQARVADQAKGDAKQASAASRAEASMERQRRLKAEAELEQLRAKSAAQDKAVTASLGDEERCKMAQERATKAEAEAEALRSEVAEVRGALAQCRFELERTEEGLADTHRIAAAATNAAALAAAAAAAVAETDTRAVLSVPSGGGNGASVSRQHTAGPAATWTLETAVATQLAGMQTMISEMHRVLLPLGAGARTTGDAAGGGGSRSGAGGGAEYNVKSRTVECIDDFPLTMRRPLSPLHRPTALLDGRTPTRKRPRHPAPAAAAEAEAALPRAGLGPAGGRGSSKFTLPGPGSKGRGRGRAGVEGGRGRGRGRGGRGSAAAAATVVATATAAAVAAAAAAGATTTTLQTGRPGQRPDCIYTLALARVRSDLEGYLREPSTAAAASMSSAWVVDVRRGALSHAVLAHGICSAVLGCVRNSRRHGNDESVRVGKRRRPEAGGTPGGKRRGRPVGSSLAEEWASLDNPWWSAASDSEVGSGSKVPWLLHLCLTADAACQSPKGSGNGEGGNSASPSLREVLVDRLSAAAAAACAGGDPHGQWNETAEAAGEHRWVCLNTPGRVEGPTQREKAQTGAEVFEGAAAAAFVAAVCRSSQCKGANIDTVRTLAIGALSLGLPRPAREGDVAGIGPVPWLGRGAAAAAAVAVVAAVATVWPAALDLVGVAADDAHSGPDTNAARNTGKIPEVVALGRIVRLLAAVPEGCGAGEGRGGEDSRKGNDGSGEEGGRLAWGALRSVVRASGSTAGEGVNWAVAIRSAGDEVIVAACSSASAADPALQAALDVGVVVEATVPSSSARRAVELVASFLGWEWTTATALKGPLSSLALGAVDILSVSSSPLQRAPSTSPSVSRCESTTRSAAAIRLMGPLYRGAAAAARDASSDTTAAGTTAGGSAAAAAAFHTPGALTSQLVRILQDAATAVAAAAASSPSLAAATGERMKFAVKLGLAAAAALEEVRAVSGGGGGQVHRRDGANVVDAALARWSITLGALQTRVAVPTTAAAQAVRAAAKAVASSSVKRGPKRSGGGTAAPAAAAASVPAANSARNVVEDAAPGSDWDGQQMPDGVVIEEM